MSERPAWRSLRVVALVAALVVAAIWYFRPLRPHTGTDARAASEARAPLADAELTPAEPAPVFPPEPSERAPAPDPDQAVEMTAEELAAALVQRGARLIEGTLVVVDPGGVALPPQNGSFSLVAWTGSNGWHHPAKIEGGAWHAIVDDASTVEVLSIAEFHCDAPFARLVEPIEKVLWPQSNQLELRAQAPHRVILTVVDAASRRELSGVTVVRSAPFPNEDDAHPGNAFDDRVVGSRLSGPIAIDELVRDASPYLPLRLLVGAPEYAWRPVELDLVIGGERIVELEHGGDLVVRVSGAQPEGDATLRLYPVDPGRPVCSVPLVLAEPIALTGLAPGDYAIRAEVGEWFRDVLVLGEVKQRVEAGRASEVELLLQAPPRVDRFEVRGRVLVPDQWVNFDAMKPTVTLTRRDAAAPGFQSLQSFSASRAARRRDGYTTFEWTRPNIPAGAYEIEISRPALAALIEVRADRTNEFELVAPPPAQLHVLVLDDATCADVEHAEVSWSTKPPAGITRSVIGNSLSHPSGRGRIIQAPATAIRVWVSSDEYQPYLADVDLAANPREHVARLQRACGAVLKMRDGDVPLPFPRLQFGEMRARSDAGYVVSSTSDPFFRRILVSAPGTYSIEFPKLDGYRAVPTQVVEIPAGQYVEHVVELERENP